MMAVLALYDTVDSVAVANLVGEEGLAAINIAYPLQGIMWGLAAMLASGSSALVGIDMGKGHGREANEKFTLVCVFSVVLGIIFTVLCIIFIAPVVDFLGADEVLTEDCQVFLSVFIWGCPLAFLGVLLEFFIRIDGRPVFTIALYASGGIVHLGLDVLLMGPFRLGLLGTALANVAGFAAMALMGMIYFIFRDTRLKFTRFKLDLKYIKDSIMNGAPDFVDESADGIMVFFYNVILMNFAGEVGVAAGAIVLQTHYLFMSIHIGYQVGSMPLISYYYGAGMFEKINRVLLYTKRYIVATSVLMAGLCGIGAPLLAGIYSQPGTQLFDMSVEGFRIVSLSLLVIGINIFVSGFLTCYGNGITSSLVSLSRGFVMLLIGLLVFPHFFGVNGAWMALPFAELTTLVLSFGIMKKYKGRYHYRILE